MSHISAYCAPLKPSFGQNGSPRSTRRKEQDDLDLLNDITSAASTIKNDRVSDEAKANEIKAVSGKIADKVNATGPSKVIIASLGMSAAGFFLGRKMVGVKVLNILDKNTKIIDQLTLKVNNGVDKLKKIKPNNDKTLNGWMSRNAKSFLEKFENFAKKGMDAKELKALEGDKLKMATALSKNAVKNGIRGIGGIVGATTGAAEVAKDKDKNGESDFLERTSELSTLHKVAKTMDAVDGAISLM